MKHNRKGTVLDMIFISGILFFLALLCVIGLFAVNKITVAINSTTGSNFETAKTATNNINNDAPGAVDFIVIMIMIGFPLASMILAFFNDIHPVLFYASFIIVIIIVLMGAAYKGLWEQFTTTDVGSAGTVSMPMTNYIMNHYGLYMLFCCIMVLFGTFVKIRSQSMGY